jgi:hypothetical protein
VRQAFRGNLGGKSVASFADRIKRLEASREEARKAIRAGEARARAAAGADSTSRRYLKWENALVEAKKHQAIVLADAKYLERHGHLHYPGEVELVAEQQRLQKAFVEEITARLERLCEETRWNQVNARASEAIAKAHAAIAQARAAAERAAALPVATLTRKLEKVTADLERHLEAAKVAIAITMGDERRFEQTQAEMLNRTRPPWIPLPPHPADTSVMARVFAEQKAAVEELRRRLWEIKDAMEAVTRRTSG